MVRLAAVGVEAREEVEALAANVAAVRLQYKGIRTAVVVREAVEALPADKKGSYTNIRLRKRSYVIQQL